MCRGVPSALAVRVVLLGMALGAVFVVAVIA